MEKCAEFNEFEEGIDKFCSEEGLDEETSAMFKEAIFADIEGMAKAAGEDDEDGEEYSSVLKQVLNAIKGGAQDFVDTPGAVGAAGLGLGLPLVGEASSRIAGNGGLSWRDRLLSAAIGAGTGGAADYTLRPALKELLSEAEQV